MALELAFPSLDPRAPRSTASTIENLTVTDSSVGISLAGSSNTRVLGNSLLNNSDYGIHCFFGDGAQIEDNYSVGNDIGIWLLFCSGATIADNVASENHTYGILKEEATAFLVGNTANRNGATGIFSINSHGTFAQNVTNANGGDGLRIADTIFSHGPSHSVTGNVSNANGGYGIAATSFGGGLVLPGVIDGGKNRAHANNAATQCIGVVCK